MNSYVYPAYAQLNAYVLGAIASGKAIPIESGGTLDLDEDIAKKDWVPVQVVVPASHPEFKKLGALVRDRSDDVQPQGGWAAYDAQHPPIQVDTPQSRFLASVSQSSAASTAHTPQAGVKDLGDLIADRMHAPMLGETTASRPPTPPLQPAQRSSTRDLGDMIADSLNAPMVGS